VLRVQHDRWHEHDLSCFRCQLKRKFEVCSLFCCSIRLHWSRKFQVCFSGRAALHHFPSSIVCLCLLTAHGPLRLREASRHSGRSIVRVSWDFRWDVDYLRDVLAHLFAFRFAMSAGLCKGQARLSKAKQAEQAQASLSKPKRAQASLSTPKET